MRRPKEVRIVSTPARPQRRRCPICGRERLSREEYAWRRKNGYTAWRCQHRKPNPSNRRGLIEAGGVITALVACIFLL
jgi:hypothetical protein